MTIRDAATLRDLSNSFWGSQVWQVRLNVQHMFQDADGLADIDGLWFDFRTFRANREPGEAVHRIGSLHVNLEHCGARLIQDGLPLVTSGDPHSLVLVEIRRLIGAKLLDIDVKSPGGDTTFRFGAGVRAVLLSCDFAREGNLLDSSNGGGGSIETWAWLSSATYISGLR